MQQSAPMTKEERYDKLYRCTVNDLIDKNFRKFQSDNIKDYIDRSIAYILRYKLDGQPPHPANLKIATLIDTARREVAIKVAKMQLSSDSKDLTDMHTENDLEVKQFISDPVGYMVAKLKDEDYYNSIKPGKFEGLSDFENNGYSSKYDKNKEKILSYISTEAYKPKFVAAENRKLYTDDILMLLGEKMPNTTINAELRRQKGGFWERFWHRTPKQYKDFKKTILKFTAVRDPQYGDRKELERTAVAYLRHKFPNLREGELPTAEQIARLGNTGKLRATFALNVVKSCREVEHADKVIEAVKGLNLTIEGLDKKEPEVKFVDNEENLAARTKKIENSNMVVVRNSENKEVKKKSSLKMPKQNPNNIENNNGKKHKRVIQFNVGGKAPLRYADSNGNQVGGQKSVPLVPQSQRKVHEYKKYLMSTEQGIKEEQELKNEIKLEEQNPKQVAPDNKEFLNELKNETEEKIEINKEEIIDTSSNKNEANVEAKEENIDTSSNKIELNVEE